MKRFATLALLLAAALPVAAGLTDLDNPGPSVVSVTARQRYPWNGLVDVDVAFEGNAGETYRIELSATDKVGGRNLPVTAVTYDGAQNGGAATAHGNPVDVPAPGTHRLVWDAAADLPAGFTADRVTVTAKLLNPIWSFDAIPAIDPDDEWAPETVYHDVQTVVSYGEIEDHSPTVRCLTDEWNLESSLGANVVFSGASMGLRNPSDVSELGFCPINLWAYSASTNVYRIVTLDYNTGAVRWDTPFDFGAPDSDVRFFCMRSERYRQFAVLSRSQGPDAFLKSTGGSDAPFRTLGNRYADAEHGSAVCGYFPNGIPVSDASSTSVSSYDKELNSAVFFSGVAGTDMKEAVLKCSSGGSIGIQTTSQYSCMGNAVGRYVVPLLDGNKYFTVGYPSDRPCVLQNFGLSVGHFTNHLSWDYWLGNTLGVAWSKGVAMPDGERIFLGGAGKSRPDAYGKVRMWQDAETVDTFSDYPVGHPFEAWNRRDVTCLLPNGKFCGVDEELGLVVVNPLTGETYVASDDPAFKKGKMGCQLLPNGKVWIIPYDCEGREYLAGTNLCGKLYEVDFGFTRSFSLSSLMSPYLKVAEGDPEPSGIKVGLDPNGGELPGIYAMYYKGENPVYGELPIPTWTGHTFLGWSTDGTAANLVAATDLVPPLGILLKAAWQANGYSVKFNANATGTTGSMSNESFVYGTAKSLTANAFAKTGYRFAGWARTATGAKAFNDKQTVSNLTATAGAVVDLYALWSTNTYTVRFNKNASDATGTMANQSFLYDESKSLTANAFARTGYSFAGWAASATDSAVWKTDRQWVTKLASANGAVVDLYAVWTPITFSVKFNANGGSGTMSNQSFTYGVAQTLTANAFTRTGYTFGGWATSATGAKVYNDKQSVSNLTTTSGGTVNLYAVWTPITYSVKFNANGGSGTMANQSYQYGTAQALTANAFTRTGYTFGGWATSATGAKVYNDKQSVSNLTSTSGGTVNLYAVWTKALYMVVDLSGGSSAMSYPVSYLSSVPSGGWTDEYKTTKLVLRRIDAGTFTMGSPTSEVGRYDNETQHSVTLTKDYFIGVFEVTQRQWELVMGTKPSYFSNTTYYKTRPVEQICYNDVRGSSSGAQWPSSSNVDSTSFVGRIRARTGIDLFDLPTEAQWERACRAGTTTAISNGRNLSDRLEDTYLHTVARYALDWTVATQSSTTSTGTAPVGSLQANPWGLYDMHGNVWEWCLDRYGALGTGSATDPKGASSGTERVFRGGAWDCMAYNCRSARRGAQVPSAKEDENEIHGHYGLRMCCGVQ